MATTSHSLPTHISTQETPNAGKCLFTSKDIAPGELVFQIGRPLVLVLDASRLKETCEGCLQWETGGHVGSREGDDGRGTQCGRAGEDSKRLKDCMGCKVVRYCGKTCQAKAWKTHHKNECKIFKSLYPKVLPNTVRLLMQLLLRRKAGSLEDAEWRDFLALQSHLDEFKVQKTKNPDGLTTWEVIELMSEAALSYSKSDEPLAFIQAMAARVLINSHTLTAPSFDPLGLCLSPTSALLNHSCDPNTAITFSQHGALSLRSLRAIPASTPLTISYADSLQPTSLRLAELSSRYHFTCTCPLCLANCTSSLSNPDIPDNPVLVALCETLQSASVRLFAAATASGSHPYLSLRQLKDANALFSSHNKYYPPHRHPRPAIHAQILLTSLNTCNWSLAFRHSLVVYFHVDPVHYVQRWHPVRVVHTWVTLRLAMQMANPAIADAEEGAAAAAAAEWRQSVDWTVVVWSLWHEVRDNVAKSHGSNTTFAAEVRDFGHSSALLGMEVTEGEKEREWARLRALAEEVLISK